MNNHQAPVNRVLQIQSLIVFKIVYIVMMIVNL